jgi:hypothetical protein
VVPPFPLAASSDRSTASDGTGKDRASAEYFARGSLKGFASSHAQIWDAIRTLVKRAIKSGDIRKGFDPIDPTSPPALTGSRVPNAW